MPLLATGLLVGSFSCSPVECPDGSIVSKGQCTSASPASTDGVMGGSGGADATMSSPADGGGGAAASAGTRMTASDAGGTAGDGMNRQVDGSSAGGSQGMAAVASCAPEGALRCGVQSNKTIESCVNGVWSLMRECPTDQACASPSSGAAECTTEAVTCDGLMCNGECVPNDERNCGTCGHDCTGLPNVVGPTTCEAGVCVFDATSCESGFAHCTDNPDDGCETKLSSVETCGGCDAKCPPTEPVCAIEAGKDVYACNTGCSEDAPVLCGSSCVDPMTDAANCGGCDKACPSVSNGQPACVAGMCTKKCNTGYHLCGDSCVSDRSPQSCGTECTPCETPTGARATCDGSRCGYECTNRSALKCEDGCFPSDDVNCGSCGNDCRASGKVCDGRTCVECRNNSDCRGSARYCVGNECRECDPGNDSTCGDCEECSSQGTCVSAGVSRVCYSDSDGDGYGGRTSPQSVCGECPSGSVTDNRDCYDSSADVHPGQSSYFETGYGSGNANFDYDCNGRSEKQALTPPSKQQTGCSCASGTCAASSITDTPCGERGSECVASGGETCGCTEFPSWVIQGCR